MTPPRPRARPITTTTPISMPNARTRPQKEPVAPPRGDAGTQENPTTTRPDARRVGRPRTLDRATLMQRVCERVANGELVADAARAEEVDPRRIREWALEDEFAPTYARARDSQAHTLAEQAIAIADGGSDLAAAVAVVLEAERADLAQLDGPAYHARRKILASLEANAIQRDRLRVDALKWYTSKIAPRFYGDRTQHEVTGSEGGPVVVRVVFEGEQA